MVCKRKSSASSKSYKKPKAEKKELVAATSDKDVVVEPPVVTSEKKDASSISLRSAASKKPRKLKNKKDEDVYECRFIGDPVPDEEARQRWPHRYQRKSKAQKDRLSTRLKSGDECEEILQAKHHYTKAKVDNHIFNLNDDAHVKADDGEDPYICKIVEMFEDVEGLFYFRAQWFYRAQDTVIKGSSNLIDAKRIFLSDIMDDNPLDCLIERIKIIPLPLNVKADSKNKVRSESDYYYDMMYMVPYSTFSALPPDHVGSGFDSDSTISSEIETEDSQFAQQRNSEMRLLDLYSGCGAMSTGICLGSNSAGVKLVTKWAVDYNKYACDSLKLNHPETEVRNESAEDFLSLLKEWEKLCAAYSLIDSNVEPHSFVKLAGEDLEEEDDGEEEEDDGDDSEVFEVEEVLGTCYGDPNKNGKIGLYFKIRWKGYGPEEDTWEPVGGLCHCQEKIKEFVRQGVNSSILPLPGKVDVICGGPPCQGISGFNRFRNADNPLDDPKNKQLVVFMDIVSFLKPKFVLMENVVDIVKFAKGFLGRYGLGRLVAMNYQARSGMMAAGAYGLPQFRMRFFLWGALPAEKLPQFPLPTHNVIVRGIYPREFEANVVGYEEGQQVELEKELFLGDAISDLPPVGNNETRDEMPYGKGPLTKFQHFIRLRRDEMPGCLNFGPGPSEGHKLYDHRPLNLNEDDYQRVCQIPKKKGANFRDLPGVRVRPDNKVEWDPAKKRVYLPSGKPLVPDYAMTFVGGTSSKPFGRLWWDETVPTVVGRAEPHNQTVTHPTQNRVLTIRENARLQGFPDYYRLLGPVKERYLQVGNAVAVPVARALGYSLGLALKGSSGEEPIFALPKNFPCPGESISPEISS